MAQVDVTYFRLSDLVWSQAKTRFVLATIALRIYTKLLPKLDPEEVSIINHWAGWHSKSAYITEVKVTLDYEDYPFLPEDFNTPSAIEACRKKAEMIWVDLQYRFHRSLLVWVWAGHMSGYYDGPKPS